MKWHLRYLPLAAMALCSLAGFALLPVVILGFGITNPIVGQLVGFVVVMTPAFCGLLGGHILRDRLDDADERGRVDRHRGQS